MKKILLLSISMLVLCCALSAQYGMSFDMSLDDSGWTSSSGANNVLWRTTTDAPASVGGVSNTARHGTGYVYSETTGGFTGQGTAYLESPCFDLTSPINQIEFFYQLSGSVSNFELEVSYNDGASYSSLINLSTSVKSGWTRSNTTQLNISTAAKFRFVVSFNAGSSSIVTIDQLRFFGASQGDAGDCPDTGNANCPENLVLDDPSGIGSDIYRASDMITANKETQTGADVALNAGNRILLTDGFSTSQNVDGDFSARIRDCVSDNPVLLEEYTRPDPIAEEEVDYFDRFGNGYARYELEEMMFHEHNTCTEGVFQLNFDPQIPQDQQDVACAVFDYLDGLINAPNVEDGTVMVDIQSDASLNSNVPAAATPFWNRLDCGIANSVVEKILIGGDPNQFGIPHGYIKINPDFDDNFYTDLNTAPDPVNDEGQLHFYTIMLHEALHMLGFASLISAPDNDPLVGDAYSRYDQYLFSLAENEHLLVSATGDCCDAHEYQPDNDPLATCGNTSFRDGVINIATVNGTQAASRLNLLSHFNTDCDLLTNNAQYVMHPRILPIGYDKSNDDEPTDALPIRDVLTCQELQVLSLIGYDVDAAISNQANCNATTTGSCDVLVVDDTFVFDPDQNGVDLMITIPIADLTANDLIKSNDEVFTYDVVTNPNFTVTDDGTDLMVTITSSTSGSYFVDYTLTACGGSVCDGGRVTVLVRGCIADPQINPCEDCDLICGDIGNFECFGSEEEVNEFFSGGVERGNNFLFTRDFNTLDLPPKYRFFTCGSGIGSDIPPLQGNNTVGMTGFSNNNTNFVGEGMVIPLCEAIEMGDIIEVSFLARVPNPCIDFNPMIRIEFLTPDPILQQSVYDLEPSPFFGQDILINNQEIPYVTQLINSSSEVWNYLLLSVRMDFLSDGSSIGIDDIRVTKQKSITITPTASSNDLCQEGRLTMTYELFNDHCSPSGDLTVALTVPDGMTLQNIGAFANGTSVNLESFEPFERRTIQAFLNVDADATIGQSVDVTLEVEPSDMNNCYVASTDIQTIDIISSPLTSITKSEPTIEDDGFFRTYSFELTVCNGLEEGLEKVLIIDNIPPEFDLETGVAGDDPFQLVASTYFKQVQLETPMAAASGGNDNCQVFRYSIKTLSDFCPYTAKAVALVPDSGCDEVTDEIDLIDPQLPKPIATFTADVDCNTGVLTLTDVSTASGLMHTWKFGDGNTSTDPVPDPMHTYVSQGTFTIEHTVDNGCDPPITIEQEVTYEPCPQNFNCTCTNPTLVGNPPDGTTNISNTSLGSSFDNTNACMQIGGTLIIDQNFTLTGGEVLMEPDAEIVVNPNVTLTITDAMLKSCDDYMWKGIRLESDANLVFTNNTIADASRAIYSQGTASIDITGNTFDRNTIGVRILDTPVNIGFSNNTFSCTSTLNNGQWGLCGLRLDGAGSDLNFFQIGLDGAASEVNTFKETHYGILAFDSRLIVYDAIFEDLRFEEGVRRFGPNNGTGIYVNNDSELEVVDNTFNRMYEGISVNGSGCLVDDNMIEDVNIGVTVRRVSLGRKQSVLNNQIKAAEIGIQYLDYILGAPVIQNNTVEIDLNQYEYVSVTNGFAELYGILVTLSNMDVNRTYFKIIDNNLTIHTVREPSRRPFAHGIRLENSSNIDLIQNTIMLKDPTNSGGFITGIELEDTDNILVSETVMQDESVNANGIVARVSTDVSYCCNTLQVEDDIFNFSGVSEGTSMNFNDIGEENVNSSNGLICQSGTTIGVQVFTSQNTGQQAHLGNKWLSDTYTEYGAVHFGTEEEASESQFIVNFSEANLRPDNATLSDVQPENLFIDRNISALNNSSSCIGIKSCALDQAPTPEAELATARRMIVRSDFIESPYSEMLNWESRQYLLRILEKYPNLRDNEQINIFYTAQRYTALEGLMNVKQDLSQAYQIDITRLSAMRNQLAESITTLADFRATYSSTNGESERASLVLEQKESIRNANELHLEYKTLLEIILSSIQADLADVRSENFSVEAENILAANERTVNNLYILHLLDEDLELNATQTQELFEVAEQCPKMGGRSVYRARTLYRLLVGYQQWDDEALCGGVEERSESVIKIEEEEVQTIVEKMDMQVFPNPAQDILNIRLSNFDMEQNYQIELYDMRGKLVLKRTLDNQQSILSIDNLAEGVYFCNLSVNGIKGTTQKVILLK